MDDNRIPHHLRGAAARSTGATGSTGGVKRTASSRSARTDELSRAISDGLTGAIAKSLGLPPRPSRRQRIKRLVLSWLIMLADMMYSGLVIMAVWNWFIPSIFDTGPQIGLAQALGLYILYDLFTDKPDMDRLDSDIEEMFMRHALHAWMMTLGLAIAFIVQLFLP